jgi:hypothetical protein
MIKIRNKSFFYKSIGVGHKYMKLDLRTFSLLFTISTFLVGCNHGGATEDDCLNQGRYWCLDECVDLASDIDNCGDCDNTCLDGSNCVEGVCICPDDLSYCSNQCIDILFDADNCGDCQHECGQNQRCNMGSCVSPIAEICDGQDNDFDGQTDEDESGYSLTRACDNLCGQGFETCQHGIYFGCTAPFAEDEVCDTEDNDCDGLTDESVTTMYYEDWDEDGYGDPKLINAVAACSMPPYGSSPNGKGYVEDNTDCKDTDSSINPEAFEVCDDDKDNNCDGRIDEECACGQIGSTSECGINVGQCQAGTKTCLDNGWGPCEGEIPPAISEICNGLDDDCDGLDDDNMADDAYEPNDLCSQASQLPEVEENGDSITAESLSIYHGVGDPNSDVDWFNLTAKEADHAKCLLPGHWTDEQCDFVFTAKMSLPENGLADDYTICLHVGEDCDNMEFSLCSQERHYDMNSHSYQLAITWDGKCMSSDDRNIYLEVNKEDTARASCEPYNLSVQMTYDGVIENTCE